MTNNVGDELLAAIKSKDVQKAITAVQQYHASMRDATVGHDYVNWLSEPANLTLVHQALAEDLNVPPRLLAIRRQLMSRTQRAVLLISAIDRALARITSV